MKCGIGKMTAEVLSRRIFRVKLNINLKIGHKVKPSIKIVRKLNFNETLKSAKLRAPNGQIKK